MKRRTQHSEIRSFFDRYHHYILTGMCLLFIAISMIITGCDVTGSDSKNEEQKRVEVIQPTTDYSGLNAINNNDANDSFASMGKAEKHRGLAKIRRATARYHDVDTAIEDGFEQILPCTENPEGSGAIGVVYVNFDRLDLTIDLRKPEVLFYEPQPNGGLQLVGGEPVVPIDQWDEGNDNPPSLFGREFHRNEDHGLYGLHMWIWKDNPEGMFSFWHPNVSCKHAQ
ncbi:hypothetical protein [Fodinibius salsisoli]|uniref:DUF4352 domain-containing protein n=1 Tax=Fodinibius salsisoli TaxID=2820877 RepID=A0ABT3PJI8_9BACT|nr:hypothetical protein [Fodinibius salsisoli]MCW9706113.1 hypothetical protein [Fodinibius salsisoli]